MTQGKYFITTAIDYANGSPHVGTAYEKIGADCIARWKRLQGFDVRFLMGMDEHSMNVEKKAVSLGKDPVAYCDDMEAKFREVWQRLGISFDDFIRTTQKRHIDGVLEFFKRVHARGDIYKAKYSGLYCTGCEVYLKEGELRDGKCPTHNTVPQRIEEENWFFALSKYTDRVREHIEKNPQFVQPEIRRNEVLNVVKDGLEDISISRSTFKFGIPLPVDPTHVIYVWFDALINYVTAVGFPNDKSMFEKWWPADLHVIGKDITRFHCALWPAMLMSAGVELPKQVWGHGWVHLEGQKQSKSAGHFVDPLEVAKTYGGDALRYFLLRDIAWDRDGDYTWPKFMERYNSDLANDLGNLLHRTLSMLKNYSASVLGAAVEEGPNDAELKANVTMLPGDVALLMDKGELHNALVRIWDAIRVTNTYIEKTAPWTVKKKGTPERLGSILNHVASSLAVISAVLFPFIPETSRRIREQLNLPPEPTELPQAWSPLPQGHTVREGTVLFPRIETEVKKA